MKRARFIVAALFTTFVTVTAHAQPCSSRDPLVACTKQGALRGTVEADTIVFKGIPYAAPPVGALRWKSPEPPARWQGVREATQFGAMCPQIIDKKVAGDENCLTLNVWRPRAEFTESLPVMIWFTGGGNHSLSGQGSGGFGGVRYNGYKLAPVGVVFVSFNFRLGALGYLAYAALDAERPEKVSGNYGNLDQIAMLRWVRENIAAFGGDPKRVLVFGTSAGGGNICALMTSPMARGLFQAAAMQSSVPTGCEIPTLADVEEHTGKRVVAALGCNGARDVAACLRAKSTEEIVSAVPGTFGVFPRIYGPNVDGHVFPDQPLKLIRERRHAAVPAIIGSTSDETIQFVNAARPVTDAASYAVAVEQVFGAAPRDRILALYPPNEYATPRDALVKATTDALFTCQSVRIARALAGAQKAPIYRFLFAHTLENDDALRALRGNHTVEHPFFFAWQGRYQPTAVDLTVQRRLISYWSRAAMTGDPNGAGNAEWPRATQTDDAYLEIGAMTGPKRGPAHAHCDFWLSIQLPWPHL